MLSYLIYPKIRSTCFEQLLGKLGANFEVTGLVWVVRFGLVIWFLVCRPSIQYVLSW